mgnify:CR=1 FL=1
MPHSKRIGAVFYRTDTGNEPVREWLKTLTKDDRFRIGTDLKTAEFGWPIGMPTCRPMGQGLSEVRTDLLGNRIARVLFTIDDTACEVVIVGIAHRRDVYR